MQIENNVYVAFVIKTYTANRIETYIHTNSQRKKFKFGKKTVEYRRNNSDDTKDLVLRFTLILLIYL